MSNYQPLKGDYVRVTIEGRVKWSIWSGTFDLPGAIICPSETAALTVEKIDPPVPPLPTTVGSVVLVDGGDYVHLLCYDGLWRTAVTAAGSCAGAVRLHGSFTVLFDAGKVTP